VLLVGNVADAVIFGEDEEVPERHQYRTIGLRRVVRAQRLGICGAQFAISANSVGKPAERAFSSIAREPSTPITSESGKRAARIRNPLPVPQPRSITRLGPG
jgi:hypothetical protein